MAIIFFEGFNGNRRLDPDYWTTTTGLVSGNVGARIIAGEAISIPGATPFTFLTLNNFGVHSAKRFYIGLGVSNFGSGGADRTFLRASDSTGAINLRVLLTNDQTNNVVKVDVYNVGTLLGTYLLPDATSQWGAPSRHLSGWSYVEMEINMASSPNTFAFRLNNQVRTSTANTDRFDFNTDLTNISKLEFFGTNIDYMGQAFDDLYIADNTGTQANTYLGTDTVVYPLNVTNDATPDPAQWTRKPHQWNFNDSVTTDDSDEGMIRTGLIDRTNLYTFNLNLDMDGREIGGLRVASTARKVSLDSAYNHVFKSQVNDLTYTLGAKKTLTSPVYRGRTDLITINPATNLPWTRTDINNSKFGVKSESPT